MLVTRIWSINPKSGYHFSDKLMDHKDKYTQNTRKSECDEYIDLRKPKR